MTLKELLDLNILGSNEYDTINLNVHPGKAYGTIGHDFYNIHFNKKAELRRVKKYMNCEITNIYGFDDGLTITVDANAI